MKFSKLLHGRLIRRYKRFLADIILDDGTKITAHVPNSGRMTSTITDDCEVWVSHHDNPKRKLKYTLELSCIDNILICTNTGVANKLGVEAIEDGTIKELQGYTTLKTEQKYGQNSRIDILLEKEDKKCFIEIKSVTLKIGDSLAFPDAVTTRGTKHLEELMEMVKNGQRAVMLYVVQRTDKLSFRIANEIDKKYYEKFKEAIGFGVEVLVYQSTISTSDIQLTHKIGFKDKL
jgi:sugar fermentation stimulation protein A